MLAGCCWKRSLHGKQHGGSWTFNTAWGHNRSAILVRFMRFAVDAHAIGRHLTGNEVYVRSLLNAFGGAGPRMRIRRLRLGGRARAVHSGRIRTRRVAAIRFSGWASILAMQVAARTVPTCCTCSTRRRSAAPCRWWSASTTSVSSSIPEYFTRDRAWQLQWTVRRTVRPRRQDSHRQRVFARRRFSRSTATSKRTRSWWCRTPPRPSSGRSRAKRRPPRCASASASPRRSCCRWAICSRARTRSA